MAFKLIMAAAKTWRRLKGENQLPKVVAGVMFRNGVEVTDNSSRIAPDEFVWCEAFQGLQPAAETEKGEAASL
jgi:hypothetical protein